MAKTKTLVFKTILIGTLALSACTGQDICLSNQHAVQIDLLSLYATTDKDTIVTVSAWGLGRTDSVYKNVSTSEIFLPLAFDSDTTTFALKLDNTTDTIQFIHSKELDFVSGECGYIFRFNIHSIRFTNNTIDSINIYYPIINYGEDAVNVKAFVY